MKIFGIGLNKTGTKTLASCLNTLGFRHSSYTSYSFHLLTEITNGCYTDLYEHVEKYDSFDDWPYPLVYPLLDQRFPGSKFILTKRSSAEKWYESLAAHSLRTDPEIGTKTRQLVYGFAYPQMDKNAFFQYYDSHLLVARNYFSDRPADMVEVCWDTNPEWDMLCKFLDCQPPDRAFPHKNAAGIGNPARVRANRLYLNTLVSKQH